MDGRQREDNIGGWEVVERRNVEREGLQMEGVHWGTYLTNCGGWNAKFSQADSDVEAASTPLASV